MSEPFDTFSAWLADAERATEIPYAHAACLATSQTGGVDARMVLVHEWGEDGFVFMTDARTEKARAAGLGAPGALVFYWGALDRQVRVRGRLAERDDATSDRCFEERPRESRITAWVSTQSRPLADPDELARRQRRHADTLDPAAPVGRPAHWRAYALVPDAIELWEARRHRLHARCLYTRAGEAWRLEMLEP